MGNPRVFRVRQRMDILMWPTVKSVVSWRAHTWNCASISLPYTYSHSTGEAASAYGGSNSWVENPLLSIGNNYAFFFPGTSEVPECVPAYTTNM